MDVCEVGVELQDFISSNVRYQSHFEILKESPRSLTASKAGNLAERSSGCWMSVKLEYSCKILFHLM